MRELNLKEAQQVCLTIAKEFAQICEQHYIPYYMLEGTMLGAVRHKGFIPWDDDMDFGVPYEYNDKLIDILQKELPEPFKCSTYNDSKCVFFPIFKVEDTSTILNDDSLPLSESEKIGINIDVFPLVSSKKEIAEYDEISKYLLRIGRIFTNSRTHKTRNIIKSIVRLIWPYDKVYYNAKIVELVTNIEPGNYLSSIFGRRRQKEFVPIEWYGEKCYYQFENLQFAGIKEYDKYLTQVYGDYMQLPSKEQQFVHSTNAFKK